MSPFFDVDDWIDDEANETTHAQGRLPHRTYASKSFQLSRRGSADDGQPARFLYKVFDTEVERIMLDIQDQTLSETKGGRYQFKVLVAREPGNVKTLLIQRVPAAGRGAVSVWSCTVRVDT